MITTLLQNAKSGDQKAMEQLIQKFSGLLYSYAKKLNYEDALSDMTLQFIEFVYRINVDKMSIQKEGAIINYICRAIKNEFCQILVKRVIPANTERTMSSLSDEQVAVIETCMTAPEDDSLEFALLVSDSCLTDYQRIVLWGIFYYGYSVSEIASRTRTSRQAVNQAKNRALKMLKRNLM